jgi:Ca2+-binding RTX toxin-like protein
MATIRGTPGPDTIQAPNTSTNINGRGGDDRLLGGDGNDWIRGGPGNDFIEGGFAGGEDTLVGGDGNDFLVAGDGDDQLSGGTGADHLDAGSGDDRLNGGAGADELFSGAGDDTALGGDGDDIIRGGLGDDLIVGGSGDDIYIYEGPGVPDNPSPGRDTIVDFRPGREELRLELFGPVSFDDLDISVAHGDTVIDLSAHFGHSPGTDTITLLGVTTLSAEDVLIF